MEPKGGVIANGQIKDNLSLGNSAWTASSNVTATAETTDKTEGTGSSDLSVAAAFATGLLAYEDTASVVDLTDQTQASFWIKSSTTTVAGQLELVLDESTGCASPDPQIPRPRVRESGVALRNRDDRCPAFEPLVDVRHFGRCKAAQLGLGTEQVVV